MRRGPYGTLLCRGGALAARALSRRTATSVLYAATVAASGVFAGVAGGGAASPLSITLRSVVRAMPFCVAPAARGV